jgi:type III secretion protein D
MKILRILTGTHAGIQARLTPGRYRIGKADDTDICITDWDDEEVAVELDETGVIRASRLDGSHGSADDMRAPAAGDDPPVVLIPDFVPFPFGTTVLCFGTEDAQWPPDIQLLASMYGASGTARAPAADSTGAVSARPGAQVGRTRRVLRALCASAMAAALLTLAGTLVYGRVGRPSQPAPAAHGSAELARQLDGALHAAQLADLHAQLRGDTIAVEGMVANAAEDVAARAIFLRMGSAVARQYDVAQTDVANIEDSLGMDGLHVAYSGGGVFTVSGVVPSLTQFREGLNRLRADLDSNVKRIDVDVTEAPTTLAMTVYTAMLAVGDTRYVQTQDGVKHLFPAAMREAGDTGHALRESVVPLNAHAH